MYAWEDDVKKAVKMILYASKMIKEIDVEIYAWSTYGNALRIVELNENTLYGVNSDGGTPLLHALKYGVNKLKTVDTTKRKILIVMTDGAPTISSIKYHTRDEYIADISKVLKDANRHGISVMFLVFGNYLSGFIPENLQVMVNIREMKKSLVDLFIKVLRRCVT